MRRFLDLTQCGPHTKVLDVGGNPRIWASVPAPRRPDIVFLNLPRAFEEGDDRERLVFADGTRLPFANQSFDIVFSNSVIEHVGDSEAQVRFAKEVQRVGKAYWVQTPNRGFPVEQHLLTPFLHWLPRGMQRAIAPRFTVWQILTKPDPISRRFYVEHYLNDIRLLRRAEVAGLFPDANVMTERFAGLAKSWIAYKRPK